MNFSENAQLQLLRQGMSFRRVVRPATIGDGIVRPDDEQKSDWAAFFRKEAEKASIVRFVPASGAASRMFADLRRVLLGEHSSVADSVFKGRDDLPLAHLLGSGPIGDVHLLAGIICHQLGLDQMPKGLIPFHRTGKEVRSAFDEQLYETLALCDSAQAHFTIHPDFLAEFEAAEAVAKQKWPVLSNVRCSFSFQNSRTDTICIDQTGQVHRDENGNAVRRPGGHGALLQNLDEIDADVIFIKNIDNVQPERLHIAVAEWKMALAGLGLKLKRLIDQVLMELDQGRNPNSAAVAELEVFFPIIPNDVRAMKDFLDRPLRICGMVRNEGQPGGGPFVVMDDLGVESLQIVESAEIDSEPNQQAIVAKATHFNPVDLVCFTRNHLGRSYSLGNFSDSSAVFIAEKTLAGRPIKALEWPGLWNGGMAHWLTVFVEVPAFTFSPVKTVADLLRPEHQ